MSRRPPTPLKQAIRESGLRQNFIAEKVGIDETYLSHIASGRRHGSDDLMRRIAAVLGRSVDEILPRDSRDTPEGLAA